MKRQSVIAASVAGAILLVLTIAISTRGDQGDPVGSSSDHSDEEATQSRPTGPETEAVDSLRFIDVTESAGLDEAHSSIPFRPEMHMTAGAAVADVDRDGDLDIFLARVGRSDRLLLNDGQGQFVDVTEMSGLDGVSAGGGSSAAAFADVDGDGNTDLVRAGTGGEGIRLHLSDGNGRFVDATASSGLADESAPSGDDNPQNHGVSFGDFDRDGRLDLLVTHWDEGATASLADAPPSLSTAPEGESVVCARADWLRDQGFPRPEDAAANSGRLYRNLGDGQFEDVSDAVGLPFDELMGFTGGFVDVDGDGWDDLLIAGDFCSSRLFRNIEGTRFEDVTEAAGVGTDENGMGSVVADLNGDGWPDWFVTSIGRIGEGPALPTSKLGFGMSGNRAYINDGDGTFTDATDLLGLRNGGWGWGAAIEDFDNDGELSVAMTNGFRAAPGGEDDEAAGPAANDPLRFWSLDEGAYVERSAEVGLTDTGLGRAMVSFDMDRDGDLDLLVANFGEAPRLYRADTAERHWISIRLDDPTTPGNHEGLGTKIVVTPRGGEPVTRWVKTWGSYESQVPAETHVGLDAADEVATIAIFWPGSSTPQMVSDVSADQQLVISRDDPTG